MIQENKKFDLLVIGELNVDLILNGIEKFPEIGKEVLAHGMTLTLGSSSAIFASNISSLGMKTAFLGKIGRDKFGEVVIDSLKTSGVDVSMVQADDRAMTGATIILNVDEDRANTTYPGAMDLLGPSDISREQLRLARHLHFSSYFLQPGMRKELGTVFKMAREEGLTTSFDMQWDPAETWEMPFEEILPHVTVFLPNEKELMLLTRQNNLEQAISVAAEFVKILVVKRGNQGSTLVSGNNRTDLPAFLNTKVVDAIGAGDSFNAGFLCKFLQDQPLAECQRFGNLTGAVSTTAAGGTAAFSSFESFRRVALSAFGVTL